MFEKVNPAHPDKLADRIAGALVDMAYKIVDNPRIAVEVLIGHGTCTIISETSVSLFYNDVKNAVRRITESESMRVVYKEYRQNIHLANNQRGAIRTGDNGIFLGMPVTPEEQTLANIAGELWQEFPTDGKFILNDETQDLIVCQSNATNDQIFEFCRSTELPYNLIINPLGEWTGGPDVDTGATNRKLGSDMGGSITGGGLHGKDLSKADVSVNIYAFMKAQRDQLPRSYFCAIGDETIGEIPYSEMVRFARSYIASIGGFEKLAEWGLIRPEEENNR